MRTLKWSVCTGTSNQNQWSYVGKSVGRKSTPRKTKWSIGGQSSKKRQWSIGN